MTERDLELIAFGLTIRQARKEKGMSPDALAAAAGLEREHLDAIEAGRFEPAVDVLVALSDVLGVGLAMLLHRADALKVQGGTPPLPATDEHGLIGGRRPPVVLREQLAAARAAGASFDEACGYTQPSYFARAFRRHYGVSPSIFRSAIGSRTAVDWCTLTRARSRGLGERDVGVGYRLARIR